MFTKLMENFWNLLVISIVLSLLGLAVAYLKNSKKDSKNCGSNSCAGCSFACSCKQNLETENKE